MRTGRKRAVTAGMGAVVVAAGLMIGETGCRREEGKAAAEPVTGAPAGAARMAASERQWSRNWTWAGGGAALAGAPAAWKDGWVVATEKGQVVAIDGSGVVRWSHSVSNFTVVGSPAVADSVVAIASAEGAVVAVESETGKPAWRIETGSSTLHGPLALGVGTVWRVVLLGNSDGVLYCFDAADGREVWKSDPTNRSDGMPGSDGRLIAYGNCDSAVHFFDAATGARASSVPVGADSQMAGGVVFLGGRVYGGTRSGNLVCVEPGGGGKLVWQVQVADGEAFVTPAAAPGVVVMGTGDGKVTAFDAGTGARRWETSVSNEVAAMSVLDDAVFVMAGGRLTGLKLKDGNGFAALAIGDKVFGPVVNGDRVAVSDDGGGLVVVSGNAGKKGAR